jgi:ABC-type antimicrobial peptide transport system permease subunit
MTSVLINKKQAGVPESIFSCQGGSEVKCLRTTALIHCSDSIWTLLVYRTFSVPVFICCPMFVYRFQNKLWIITSHSTLALLFHFHWTIGFRDIVSSWVKEFLVGCSERTLLKHLLLTWVCWWSTCKIPNRAWEESSIISNAFPLTPLEYFVLTNHGVPLHPFRR